MIHVVRQSNRHLYARQLWELSQLRRAAPPRSPGWDALMVFDAAVVDELDDARAVYLMALDDDGALLGVTRARPTDDGSVLYDRRPDLIAPDQASLKGEDTWEGVRVFTTPGFRCSDRPGQRGLFGLALASREAALDAGARRMVGVMDVRMLEGLTAVETVEVKLLGLPAQYDCGVMVAACVEVSAKGNARALESLAEPLRLSFEVTDEDVAVFGSVIRVQEMVDTARGITLDPATAAAWDRDQAIAEAEALFARHDTRMSLNGAQAS